MIILRIGLGQDKSGKVLDKNTYWYNLYEDKHILDNVYIKSKPLFISINNKKYQKISYEELLNLLNKNYENNQ